MKRIRVDAKAAVSFWCLLAACGGGGSGAPPTPPSKLFAADSGHFAIGSLVNPNPAAGAVAVDRIIMGPNTGLSNDIASLALDTANDRLYVGNGVSIRVFDHASLADGNVAPTRVIMNTSGGGHTGSLFLDASNDRLYVGDDVIGVRVFDNVSAINGATASSRLITGFGQVLGVAVDAAKNLLYVSNRDSSGTSRIAVFAPADAANNGAVAARTITPHFNNLDFPLAGIFLDAAHDRIYAAGGSNFLIMVFDGASTLNGPSAPTKTLTFPGSGAGFSSVVVDTANDRLYAVSLNEIAVLSNVSTASGPATGTAALPPPQGFFTALAVSP